MKRAVVVAAAGAVLVACGGSHSKPALPAFDPPPGAPACDSGKPMSPTDAEATWKAMHDALGALGREVGTPYDDAPLVIDALRTKARALLDEHGCVASGEASAHNVKYECGALPADAEAERRKIETAVNTYSPRILAAAEKMKNECLASGPGTWVKLSLDSAAKGKGGSGPGAHAEVGCTILKPEVCQRSCEAGVASSCQTFVMAAGADTNEMLRRGVIACDAARARQLPKPYDLCIAGMTACWSPKGDAALCGKLLDGVCDVAPTEPSCVVMAIDEKRAWYDAKRAAKALDAVAACEGPTCNYGPLCWVRGALYSKERAMRAAEWVEKLCTSGSADCIMQSSCAFASKDPHYDAARAERVADALEKHCSSDAPGACVRLWEARQAEGGAPRPDRAYEIASQQCDKDATTCFLLASCFAKGVCGKPKDQKRAIELGEKACSAWTQKNPKGERAWSRACTDLDAMKSGK